MATIRTSSRGAAGTMRAAEVTAGAACPSQEAPDPQRLFTRPEHADPGDSGSAAVEPSVPSDRQANHALWQIMITRMSSHPPTRAYVARRTEEGLSKKEIIRCLKRYVAREVYPHLRPPAQAPGGGLAP